MRTGSGSPSSRLRIADEAVKTPALGGTGQARQPAAQGLRFLGYLAYGLSVALAIPAIILLGLLLVGRPRRKATVS